MMTFFHFKDNLKENYNKLEENVENFKQNKISKKIILKLSIVIVLLIIFIYVCNISFMPESIIMMQGETLNINTILGINLEQQGSNGEILEASSSINKNKVNEVGKLDLKIAPWQRRSPVRYGPQRGRDPRSRC